jgi:hypothetical protein
MRNHASTITRLPFTGPGRGYPPPGSRHHKKHQTADALNKNCLNVGGHPGTYLSYLSYFAYFYTAFHLPSHLRNPGAGRTASLGRTGITRSLRGRDRCGFLVPDLASLSAHRSVSCHQRASFAGWRRVRLSSRPRNPGLLMQSHCRA